MHIHIRNFEPDEDNPKPTGFIITLYENDEGVGSRLCGKTKGIEIETVVEMIVAVLVEKLNHPKHDVLVDGEAFEFGRGISIVSVVESAHQIKYVKDYIFEWVESCIQPNASGKVPPKPYPPGGKSRHNY